MAFFKIKLNVCILIHPINNYEEIILKYRILLKLHFFPYTVPKVTNLFMLYPIVSYSEPYYCPIFLLLFSSFHPLAQTPLPLVIVSVLFYTY